MLFRFIGGPAHWKMVETDGSPWWKCYAPAPIERFAETPTFSRYYPEIFSYDRFHCISRFIGSIDCYLLSTEKDYAALALSIVAGRLPLALWEKRKELALANDRFWELQAYDAIEMIELQPPQVQRGRATIYGLSGAVVAREVEVTTICEWEQLRPSGLEKSPDANDFVREKIERELQGCRQCGEVRGRCLSPEGLCFRCSGKKARNLNAAIWGTP